MKRTPNLVFDYTLLDLFKIMEKIQKEYKLNRINDVIAFKALLDQKNSILLECLCGLGLDEPYKRLVKSCDSALRKIGANERKISKDEETFNIQDPIDEVVHKFYIEKSTMDIIETAVQNALEKEYGSELENGEFDIEDQLDGSIIEEQEEMDSKEEKGEFDTKDQLDSSNTEQQEETDSKEGNEEMKILVSSEDLFITMILTNMPDSVWEILRENSISIEGIKEFYEFMSEVYDDDDPEIKEYEEKHKKSEIPKALSDFVTALSSKYVGQEECEFLGREKECKRVMRILQKRGKKNAVLVGPAGCGKTAVSEMIAFYIANGKCPEALKDKRVLQLNVNDSIAGTTYRGDAEKRFKLLVDYLKKNDDVILFIDEMHMIIGAGATSKNDSNDMSNSLKQFLASPDAKVIGATTEEEYNRIISRDAAFKRRFKKISVKEPTSKQVYPMLKNAIKKHEEFHGVAISEEMVGYAVLISSCFNNTTCNPDRTNDLIDSAMVIAKEDGKKEVDRESILENFEISFEKYEKMDESMKRSTAYHEAGHYLVWKMLGIQRDRKAIAVSIMPAEDYLGVTVYDDISDEVTVPIDRNYFIASIAKTLAGREAQKIKGFPADAGANSDLENANKNAYRLVMGLGLASENDDNIIYIEDDNYHMMSDKVINDMNQKRSVIINEATKLAHETLIRSEKYLDILADELVKKGILDENDLNKIFEENTF